VKRLISFAVGTLLSLGAVTSASAAGANLAAPAYFTDEGVEVIVVTAKRPAALAVAAEQPIYEVVVTAKRATKAETDRTPPAMAIEMPKLELARSEPTLFRL
jgi:hypothetical protein